MIDVTQAGFYTSVQDLGREAWRHLGVGLSGAMDPVALAVVNLMLGNAADAAGLEITMGRACLTFRSDTEIALGGAPAPALLDGRPLSNWWAISVRAGQVLTLASPEQGVRSYLAFRGGLAVNKVLGSASTDLKGGFGGHEGRALKNGDALALRPTASLGRPNQGFGLCPWLLDPCADGERSVDALPVLHVLPAAQWPDLPASAQQQFVETVWKVSPQSNRVGCRLEGPALPMPGRREMRSHGIMPGVVQLPPSGQPIVQLCDGNTSGGYPVIAAVIRADLHRFAQLRPGSPLRFAVCDIAQAEARWARRLQFMDDVALRCDLARRRFS